MSGKPSEGGRADDSAGGVEGSDRADRSRDYGDSAGYGGGAAALDYDDVLGDAGRGRKLDSNPLDEVIPDRGGASEDAIRGRAYAKWDEAGRPEGRDDEFWAEAERELKDEGGA